MIQVNIGLATGVIMLALNVIIFKYGVFENPNMDVVLALVVNVAAAFCGGRVACWVGDQAGA